jgi:hypothetical protein
MPNLVVMLSSLQLCGGFCQAGLQQLPSAVQLPPQRPPLPLPARCCSLGLLPQSTSTGRQRVRGARRHEGMRCPRAAAVRPGLCGDCFAHPLDMVQAQLDASQRQRSNRASQDIGQGTKSHSDSRELPDAQHRYSHDALT